MCVRVSCACVQLSFFGQGMFIRRKGSHKRGVSVEESSLCGQKTGLDIRAPPSRSFFGNQHSFTVPLPSAAHRADEWACRSLGDHAAV